MLKMNLSYSRSESDEKEYRLVSLEKGLRCLLVSNKLRCEKRNENNSKAAAGLAVQVGSFSDPANIAEGCAHFLEHMLFMGSEKYPDENSYDSFVTTHGGSCNAFTEGEYTVYQFDVNHQYFHSALDIFAQCFISPILTPGATGREINAIESEFNIAKTSDSARLQQLFSHQSTDGHVLRKFSWGNLNSLSKQPAERGVDVLQVLKDFHKKHYTPDNMALVVLAPLSLDNLEQSVRTCFEQWDSCTIANTATSDKGSSAVQSSKVLNEQDSNAAPLNTAKIIIPSVDESLDPWRGRKPCDESVLKQLTRLVPVRNSHKLVVTWQLPPVLAAYRTQPCGYLAHLIGHEGPGSLLSALKSLNFASNVSAGVSDSNSDLNTMFTLFVVSVTLTENGLANWTEVVAQVHTYLRMIQKAEPQQWIFEEMKQLADTSFKFLDEEESSDIVERLAMEMLPCFARAPEDILGASFRLYEFDPVSISTMLKHHMTVRLAKIDLISSAFASSVPCENNAIDSASDKLSVQSDTASNTEGSECSMSICSNAETSVSDGHSVEESEESDEETTASSHCDEDLQLSAETILGLYQGPKKWIHLVIPTADTITDTKNSKMKREPHFGTVYWQDMLPEDLLAYWGSCTHNSDMQLPPRNPYIPHNFTMISGTCQELTLCSESMVGSTQPQPYRQLLQQRQTNNVLRVPNRITLRDGLVLWHLLDTSFGAPKVEIYIRFISPAVLQDACSAALLDLLSRVLKDSLNETIYMAEMAGLYCSIETSDAGLGVKVGGFSDKADVLVDTIVSALLGCTRADSKVWASLTSIRREKEQLMRYYRNKNLRANQSATNGRILCLKPSKTSADNKATALEAIGNDQNIASTGDGFDAGVLRRFAVQFCSSLCVEILAHGNISETAAVAIADGVLKRHVIEAMASAPNYADECSTASIVPANPPSSKQWELSEENYPLQPILPLLPNTALILHRQPQYNGEQNVCVEIYFQQGSWDLRTITQLDLLEQLIAEPFFDQLRTKQQLGYRVSCGVRQTYGTLGFCFQVVSSSFDIPKLQNSILDFVESIPMDILTARGCQYYADNLRALIARKLCPESTLSDAAARHWSTMEDRNYNFFHAQEAQAAILSRAVELNEIQQQQVITQSTNTTSSCVAECSDTPSVDTDATAVGLTAMVQFVEELFFNSPKMLIVHASRDKVAIDTAQALPQNRFRKCVVRAASNVPEVHAMLLQKPL